MDAVVSSCLDLKLCAANILLTRLKDHADDHGTHDRANFFGWVSSWINNNNNTGSNIKHDPHEKSVFCYQFHSFLFAICLHGGIS